MPLKSLLCLTLAAYTLAAADFALRPRETGMQLYYGDTLLLTQITTYITTESWKPLVEWSAKNLEISEGGVWSRQKRNEYGSATLSGIQESPSKIIITAEYDIPSESPAHHIVFDLFFNRDFFYEPLVNRLESVAGVFRVKTKLGTLLITPLTSDTPGTLRDQSKAAWRSSECRTITLLTDFIKEKSIPFRKTFRIALEFLPDDQADAVLRGENLKAIRNTLEEQNLPLSENAVALLESACASLAKTDLDAAEKAIYSELRGRKTYAAVPIEGIVIPRPRKRDPLPGELVLAQPLAVAAADTDAEYAAEILRDELENYRGLALDGEKTFVTIGSNATALPAEGYRVEIRPDGATISGNGSVGAIHGVQTLIQLLQKRPDGKIAIPCCRIEDWPEDSFRGLELIASGGTLGRKEFQMTAVRRLLSRYKYNVLFLGDDQSGNVERTSYPEIKRDSQMPRAYLREVLAYARAHGLKTVPVVQSLGHNNSALQAHPEWADDLSADAGALCMSNPEVRQYLSKCFDEVIEDFQCDMIHIGCDEVFSLARNPLCQGRAPEELFLEHITWIHDELAKRGCKTVMWSDMLLENGGRWGRTPANSTPDRRTHTILEQLPRDLIFDLWSYHETGSVPAMDHFRDLGFQVLGSGWFTPENYQAIERAIRRRGALGSVATTWMVETFCTPTLTSIAGVDAAWQSPDAFTAQTTAVYDEHAHRATLPPQPSNFADTRQYPIAIPKGCLNAERDPRLALLPDGRVTFSGLDFDIPAEKCVGVRPGEDSPEIPIDQKAKSLIFLHGAKTTFEPFRVLGYYIVRYTDGSSTRIELRNRRTLLGIQMPPVEASYSERLYNGYMSDARPAWRGVAPSGVKQTLLSYEWTNPYPDKTIRAITLEAPADSRSPWALYGLTAVR